MSARTPAAPGRTTPSPVRRVIAMATVAATALVGVVAAAPAQAEELSDNEVTMVQANIKTGMALNRFRSDVAKVMAAAPDFVTYNEVPFRKPELLAPEGYSLHRDVRDRYTAATPVAWRHPEWTKVDAGTFKISNLHTIPDGKHTKLGLRYANWATLRSQSGRQLSVVAVHFAPLFKIDGKQRDLVRPSARRLGQLVETLAASGPVLVGGDFNVHYKSRRYPRDLFEAAGLVPTYDTLGAHFPTGDHRGATIDYLFNRGADQLQTTAHRKAELYSDHDAVIADLAWQVPAPNQTREVVSDPNGGEAARRAVVTELVGTIGATPSGASLEVVTAGLNLWAVFKSLRGAVARGVHVRLVTRSGTLTRQERRLASSMRRSGDRQSLVTRCVDDCRRQWWDAGGPRTMLLVQGTDSDLRADVNRNLTGGVVRRRTKLVYRSGADAVESGARLLRVVR